MSLLKTPYEISIWEDRLTFVDPDGNEYNSNNIPSDTVIMTSYFKEIKLCIIGSDTLEAPFRAFEPQLARKTNGENKLTFSIYSKYYNEELGVIVDNPFIPLLTNERKIKLKFFIKGKLTWLDFIIKNISESSSEYKFTYTAIDLSINELSKNGFDLTFDNELKNNQGSVNYLGKKVLLGTDWQIGEESELIKQFQEEALYKIVLDKDIQAENAITGAIETIYKNSIIYAFYNSIMNKDSDFFQFIFDSNGEYPVDENGIIYDVNNYLIPMQDWNDNYSNSLSPTFYPNFRGERIVKYQLTKFEPLLDQPVKVYTDLENNEVYGYTKYQYITEKIAQNYITNSSKFSSLAGWQQNNKQKLKLRYIPTYEEVPLNSNLELAEKRFAVLEYTQIADNLLFNSGFKDNVEIIKEIVKDDKYVLRIKAGDKIEDYLLHMSEDFSATFKIQEYELNELGNFILLENTKIFEGVISSSTTKDLEDFIIFECISNFSLSEKELKNKKIGFFLEFDKEGIYYIQDIQFFKYALDKNGKLCLPNGKVLDLVTKNIEDGLLGYSQKNNYFYYPDLFYKKEDIQYIYIGEGLNGYTPKYTNNYEKIRSISQRETNRFDLLQSLSEIFECWCRFEVKHKDSGEILLGKDLKGSTKTIYSGTSTEVMNKKFYTAGNSKINEKIILKSDSAEIIQAYQQQKFVTFHKNIGQENSLDIIYGINLKSITRTIESENTISKLIVKNNNNEFAKNKSCSISRALENLSGENYLFNFDYFVKQGLLNYEDLNNDLYSLKDDKKYIGFYPKMKRLNQLSQDLIENQSSLQIAFNEINADYQVLQLEYEAAAKELKETEEEFYELTKNSYDNISPDNSWLKEKNIIALVDSITKLRIKTEELLNLYNQKKNSVDYYQKQLDDIQTQLDNNVNEKKKIKQLFEKKYHRFIQEGPWTSEDYIDDNLYYLDAEKVLYKSSRPEVSYTIDVIEVSNLDGYENYMFELGDITHIQDTEFFGWTYKNNIKVPYREKIVVTEKITNFDSPEKDQIKVQNYRTQFEDLFQRLTYSAQKIEFNSGSYERINTLINSNGNIASKALQDAFNENTNILKNATNQSVVWNETGITTKNLTEPNELVRITSGGIFLTNNGGETWEIGISGNGINARNIVTGQLNTELVSIITGDQTSFRWDSLGISAYQQENLGNYNNNTYVRFDQYGIYGIKGIDGFTPVTEKDIWDKASFALTWNGFMLRSSGEGGAISIDSEKDFNVYGSNDLEKELIRIGRLDDNKYGITIRDNQGNIGFKATSEGLTVGGWIVEQGGLYSVSNEKIVGLYSEELKEAKSIANSGEKTDWAIIAGNNFGVDYNGAIYASSGSIGGITFDEETGLLIPSSNIDGISVKENGKTIFEASVAKKEVNLGKWNVNVEGLIYNDQEGQEMKLTPSGLTANGKTVSWGDIVDFITSNNSSDSSEI